MSLDAQTKDRAFRERPLRAVRQGTAVRERPLRAARLVQPVPVQKIPVTRPAEPTKPEAHHDLSSRAWGAVGTAMSMVAVVIGTLAVVVAAASHFSPPGQYTVFGRPVLSVLSGSMSPAIRTGDLAVDDPVNASQAAHLHVGQIITFRTAPGSHTTLTHRIHAINSSAGVLTYRTKGDANNAQDGPLVAPSQIVGVYRTKVPYGGYLLNSLHKPITLGLLIASPILWLLSSWLFAIAREDEDEDHLPALAGEQGVAIA